MNKVKYLFPLWAGVLVYASLSCFFGVMGISAQRQLEKEREKQEMNIEDLKRINDDLESTMNSLLYDKDTLAVYARELGYASADERFIRIVGLGVDRKSLSSAGKVVVAAAPQYTPDRSFRIIALCAGISLFICIAVSDFLKFLRNKQGF